jgi:signal transduction histidine kinase
MSKNYSDAAGAGGKREAQPTASEAEITFATELLGRLFPAANVDLLIAALLAERAAPPRDPSLPEPREADLDPPERELRRARTQLALGETARTVQHALNNPLTALLAEAQLLELEPLAEEHRLAVARMVELARRVATVTRRLDVSQSPRLG